MNEMVRLAYAYASNTYGSKTVDLRDQTQMDAANDFVAGFKAAKKLALELEEQYCGKFVLRHYLEKMGND